MVTVRCMFRIADEDGIEFMLLLLFEIHLMGFDNVVGVGLARTVNS